MKKQSLLLATLSLVVFGLFAANVENKENDTAKARKRAQKEAALRAKHEQAKKRVSEATGKTTQLRNELKSLDSQIDAKEKELNRISGDQEYTKDFEHRRDELRRLRDQRNKKAQEITQAQSHHARVLKEVGKHHVIHADRGDYSVNQQTRNPKPAAVYHDQPAATTYSTDSGYHAVASHPRGFSTRSDYAHKYTDATTGGRHAKRYTSRRAI